MLSNIYFREICPCGKTIKKSGMLNPKPRPVGISGREAWGCDREDAVWTVKKQEMFWPGNGYLKLILFLLLFECTFTLYALA